MFALTTKLSQGNLSVRPVNKTTDRPVIREIFRREFYGDNRLFYPDEGLWEIYDRMETNDVFGAYLVTRGEQVMFLLEVHPPIQMDVIAEYLSAPGTIGIYCFGYCRDEAAVQDAFGTCIGSLFVHAAITRILTSLSHVTPYDPRARLLERSGFRLLTTPSNKLSVYCCTRDGFKPPAPAIRSTALCSAICH
jgi:hypothetical protein